MNRLNLELIPVISPRPVSGGVISKTFTYENNTGVPVYITDATGGHIVVNPKPGVIALDSIIVYVTYKAARGSGNLSGLLEGIPGKAYPSLVRDLQATGEATLMYVIDDVSSMMRGDLLVVKKLGLAFSTAPAKMDKTIIKTSMRNNNQFVVGVVVVQRHDDPRDYRWVRYYTKLVEVEPMRSKFYEEGIYMIITGGDDVEGGMLKFEFDELMSPFKVFEQRDDAVAFIWKMGVPEIREVKRQMEIQLADHQKAWEERKAAMELEHKGRLNELALDKESVVARYRDLEFEQKRKQDERKDHYESRSLVRKDGSETLKAIPAFFAAGVALVGLLM